METKKMPSQRWLKTFSGLFLKYRNIFRLPRTSRRLVELSKGLKGLRAVLGDPSRIGLWRIGGSPRRTIEFRKLKVNSDCCRAPPGHSEKSFETPFARRLLHFATDFSAKNLYILPR